MIADFLAKTELFDDKLRMPRVCFDLPPEFRNTKDSVENLSLAKKLVLQPKSLGLDLVGLPELPLEPGH